MTEILAVAAFFISFATVFLVNDALRKTERKHDAAVKQMVDKLTKDMDRNSRHVEEMKEITDTINDADKSKSMEIAELKNRLTSMESKLNKATEELQELNDLTHSKARKARKSG